MHMETSLDGTSLSLEALKPFYTPNSIVHYSVYIRTLGVKTMHTLVPPPAVIFSHHCTPSTYVTVIHWTMMVTLTVKTFHFIWVCKDQSVLCHIHAVFLVDYLMKQFWWSLFAMVVWSSEYIVDVSRWYPCMCLILAQHWLSCGDNIYIVIYMYPSCVATGVPLKHLPVV